MHVRFNTRWLWIAVWLVALIGLVPAAVASADTGAAAETEFVGVVRSLPASGLIGDWTVNMRTIHVTQTTVIDQTRGPAVVGAYVRVRGVPQRDGSLNATRIDVISSPGNIPVKFFATVRTLPASGLIGDWTVTVGLAEVLPQGFNLSVTRVVTLHVTSATRINEDKGAVAVGAFVKVEGLAQPDHSVNAAVIEVIAPPPPPDRPIEFFGRIEALPTTTGWIGDWKVSGRTVHVSSATRIDQTNGQVQIGAFVKVTGTVRNDRSVDATEIVVRANPPPPPTPPPRHIKFYGVIQELPTTTGWIGDWKVSGITVHVTATTQIKQTHGAPAVGKPVEVKGILQNDGTVNALQIETKRSAITNSPFGKASAFAQADP